VNPLQQLHFTSCFPAIYKILLKPNQACRRWCPGVPREAEEEVGAEAGGEEEAAAGEGGTMAVGTMAGAVVVGVAAEGGAAMVAMEEAAAAVGVGGNGMYALDGG
jgi:hypothetical protein